MYVNLAEKLRQEEQGTLQFQKRFSEKSTGLYTDTVQGVVTERENKILQNLKIMAGKDNL